MKPEHKRPLGENVRILLKCILKKVVVRVWTGICWHRVGPNRQLW
jgi:hypothetical protein